MRLGFLSLILLAALLSPPAKAPARPLRVGYLTEGGPIPAAAVEALLNSLQADEQLMATLAGAGYDAIVGSRAASVRDLVESMEHGLYDLVFAPVSALRGEASGRLRVVFQLRRPGDAWDPRGGIGVRQQSVLIRRQGTDVAPSDGRWAFVGGQSASGYIYPRLLLMERFGVRQPGEFVFRPNAEEVFYMVANGLADFGAMERATFEDVLQQHDERVSEMAGAYAFEPATLETFATTAFYPSAPILFAAPLQEAQYEPGRALRQAVRYYFESDGERFGLTLVPAREEWYDPVRSDLSRFYGALELEDTASPLAGEAGEPEPSTPESEEAS